MSNKKSETVKSQVDPIELAKQKKRQAARLFKLRQIAKAAGISFTMKATDEALAKYCTANFGVSIEEYCSDEFTSATASRAGGSTANLDELGEQIDLHEVDMSDPAIVAKKYKPWKTGTIFDKVASRHHGLYPASVIIMTGESGAGKTTLACQVTALAQRNNKNCKGLFLSGEMNFVDWQEECSKFPILRELSVIYMRSLNKYTGDQYLAAIRKALFAADIIVLDSLVVIADRIKDNTNMSANEATFWLIDQMNELAETYSKTFIAIQHYTKGGKYVGSSRLKHDTTAMILCMIGENNKTCFFFLKNRRGDRKYLNKPMHFDMPDGAIQFDEDAFESLMKQEELSKQRDAQVLTRDKLMELINSRAAEQMDELATAGAEEEEEDEF